MSSRSRSKSPARQRVVRQVKKEHDSNDEQMQPSTTPPRVVADAAAEVDSFGGPILKLFIMLSGPLFIQFAWASCELDQCHLSTTAARCAKSLDSTVATLGFAVTPYAIYTVAFWFVTQALFRLLLPAQEVLGYVQRDGQRLTYKLNGGACLLATALVYPLCVASGLIDIDRVTSELRAVIATFQLTAFAISLALVIKARVGGLGERHGFLTDYFFGSELNPRVFGQQLLDVKFFLETHALIMWMVWEALFAYQYWTTHAHTLSVALCVTLLVHIVYVVHHMSKEAFVLGVIDFTSDNMGWMLTWGNLVHVGFYFPLSVMYVAHNDIRLEWGAALAIIALAAYGLRMFSESNLQKHQFRTDPTRHIWGTEPRSLQTLRGTRLLWSGWWCIGRKMNYTGDLILALCHGLPAGFDAIMPHLYFAYLLALLVHRCTRDEAACRAKYGRDWDAYCALVPFTMLPGVY